MDAKWASLRRLVRLHVAWLTYVLLGKELVSEEDLADLKKYGKLSLGDEISFIEKAFALGRAHATLTQADYGSLTLDKLSRFEKKKFSSAEKLAVREAKLHADRYIQTIAEEVVAASSEAVNEASAKLVNDVLHTMADELSAAVLEKKSAKDLASKLSSTFNRGFKKDWTKFATTELHRAKIRGAAMAIANKVDVYSKSAGIDSDVSVVPDRSACSDCLSLYTDDSGNPKVFKLKEMLKLGTNADAKHTRNKNGLHSNWKAVMPPAHPHCYCTLVYVPPGMAWHENKLLVADSLRYNEYMTKAVDQGSMSATITPPGPKSSQGPKIPKTRSMPGLPAPGNTPGPGAPTSSAPTAPKQPASSESPSVGPRKGMVDCPFGDKKECVKYGGDGADTHKVGGSIMQAHAEYQKDRGSKVPENPELVAAQVMAASDWKIEEHPSSVAMQHLEKGDIIQSKPLGAKKAGINKNAKQIFIAGNGSALLKVSSGSYINDAHHEVAAYKLFSFMGSNACPMTGMRTIDGKSASSQAWLFKHSTAADAYKEAVKRKYTNKGDLIKVMLEKSKDPEALRKSFNDMSVMDMVMNNLDRHFGNLMVDEDKTEVKAVDHGFSFGLGYSRYRNDVHEGFNSLNMHTRLTPEMNNRFNNTSFTDMKKSLRGELSDRQVSQTYLRMRYVQSVQEEHNHLPYSEFEHVSILDSNYNHTKRESGNDKFEDFAIDFIDKHSKDPSSPEYAAAFEMRDLGIFLDPQSHLKVSSETAVARGHNFEYEKKVRIHKAAHESIRRGEGDFLQPLLTAAGNQVYIRYKKEFDKASTIMEGMTAENQKLNKEYVSVSVEIRDALLQLRPSEELEAHKEKLFAAKEESKAKLAEAKKAYDRVMLAINMETRKGYDKVYETFVPSGEEKTFNRLNAAIDRVRGSRSAARAVVAKDYSKVRPNRPSNPAADREAAKRPSDNDITEKIDRNV